MITGGIGTGKTTLCRVLLDHLEPRIKSALIFNTFISDMDLLSMINQEFGIGEVSRHKTKKGHIDELNRFLLETYRKGGNAVLLIDEAQNLSPRALEQIRMLSNLETTRDKLIQILLVGQPELNEILAAPSMRQLNERVMVRYNLKPLAFGEVREYVEHRMVVAGARGDVRFTPGAFRRINAYSRGNPRRINTVCDRALLAAYVRDENIITSAMVKRAALELSGSTGTFTEANVWSLNSYSSYIVLLLLFITVASLGGWSFSKGLFGVTPGMGAKNIARMGIIHPSGFRTRSEIPSIFLNEQASLSRLFTLFYEMEDANREGTNVTPLNVVQYNLDPEYYIMLKRPFRVSVSGPDPSSAYLLIRKVGTDAALAIDSDGEKRMISREFVLKHWGRNVSWLCPQDSDHPVLRKGMTTPAVLALQRTLNGIGYMVDPTGIYDQTTIQEVARFQKDFGLSPDGIAGPVTRSLLFQMVKEDELH